MVGRGGVQLSGGEWEEGVEGRRAGDSRWSSPVDGGTGGTGAGTSSSCSLSSSRPAGGSSGSGERANTGTKFSSSSCPAGNSAAGEGGTAGGPAGAARALFFCLLLADFLLWPLLNT